MILIKYNNEDTKHGVTFSRVSDNIIRLEGGEENESGFLTFRMDGETQLGDFSDYTTIYKIEDNAVLYSNNGIVYEHFELADINTPDFPEDYIPQPSQLDRIEAQCLYTALCTNTIIEEV